MEILLLDNYDSYTFNLRQLLTEAGAANITILQPHEYNTGSTDVFDGIVFSPGPDIPRPENVMSRILNETAGRKPVLGICLGFQAIALHCKAILQNMQKVKHGETVEVHYEKGTSNLFTDMDNPFQAGLYHSWAVREEGFRADFRITARDPGGIPMAGKHAHKPWEGVQFHPESYMTPGGKKIISNWIQYVEACTNA